MGFWIILALLVVLALAAPRYGADSRTSDSWTAGRGERPATRYRATVRGDLAALRSVLVRQVRGGLAALRSVLVRLRGGESCC